MKKLTLLAATSVSLALLGGLPLTAEAANQKQVSIPSGYNQKITVVTNPGNLQNILGGINGSGCITGIPTLPGIVLPGGNNKPEKPIVTPGPEEKPGTGTTDPGQQSSYAEEVVRLVNQERAKKGLKPVTMATNVKAAAQVRAKEIQTSFSHTRPDGRNFQTALQEQNVSFRGYGENIAWGQKSPEQVMSGWMNSEGHKKNILNPSFTTIGVGYFQSANGTNYWTQLFTY